MNWVKKSQNHLIEADESYWAHAFFAIKWGIFLLWTGLVSIVHGLLPFLFPFIAPQNILKMKHLIDERDEEKRIHNATSKRKI